ncbi:MAG: glutamine synthetase family protein [Deltaproteobacteria bacterium]|nr:glutamine synthetase family protein [Deltaproteobacteria bacterium]
MADLNKIKKELETVDTTKIFFVDFNGRIMNLPVNPDNIESILENGIGFDGSSIAGYGTVDSSDRLLFPDADSFKVLRFSDENVGFIIASVYDEKDKPAKADPRAMLKKTLAEAKRELGIKFLVGPEHEFFLLNINNGKKQKNLHTDQGLYFQSSPHDKGEAVRNRIVKILKDCGIAFEKAHHEVTPSQHEINLEPTDPLNSADRTVLFNYVTQETAADFGYRATFMPKPFDGYNRNALHLHLSGQDLDGNNVFYDKNADHNIGTIARQFIGGILKYARETSIIMASTFNSYKAYVSEREAPIICNWGFKNRSTMVRIPYCPNPQSTRLELRSPDPAGNVYLQVAILIAMGMEGIRNKIDCGEHATGTISCKDFTPQVWDTRFLPKCMYEALVEAEGSSFLKQILGEETYQNFMTLKTREWEEHRTHVTHREISMYLDR